MKLFKKTMKINFYIAVIFLFILFALFYYFYYKGKNQKEIYVSAILVKQAQDISSGLNPYWVPRFVADSIETNNQDKSPVGGLNATVLEKKVYDLWSNGNLVYLLLKVKSTKDRSGVYLFKSKPLLVGSVIDLKINKTQALALVTYLGESAPQYKKEELVITMKGEVDPWIAKAIKVGSLIKNENDETEVEILEKKVYPGTTSGMRYDTASQKFVFTDNLERKGIEIKVRILTDKIGEDNYYAYMQKIKVNEWLYLPFKEVSVSLPIIFISTL